MSGIPSSAAMPSGPTTLSERKSATSSTRSASSSAAAKIGPASTISRLIPRSARRRSAADQIEPAVDARHGEDGHACCFKRRLGGGRRLRGGHDPEWDLARAAHQTGAERQPQLLSSTTRTGERRTCRAAGRSIRIVGERGADADQIASRAPASGTRARAPPRRDRGRLAAGQPALPSADTASLSGT